MLSWKRWLWGGARAGRQEYWSALVVLMLVGWLAHPLAVALAASNPLFFSASTTLLLLTEVAGFWVQACLVARRLHDLGRTGWWQLAPLTVLLAGYALAEPAWATALGLNEAMSISSAVGGAVVYLLFLLSIGVMRGEPEPNRFGPPPPLAPSRRPAR